MRCVFQRWCGETVSYGSATLFSHGRGVEPTKLFSMFSVRPPLVEKKKVVTGAPW